MGEAIFFPNFCVDAAATDNWCGFPIALTRGVVWRMDFQAGDADMKHSARSCRLPLTSIVGLFLEFQLAVSVYAYSKTLLSPNDSYFKLQARFTDQPKPTLLSCLRGFGDFLKSDTH